MPVTAKLSRRFYEQFGDELTNELVEWFNSVDATYRSDLKEVNELHFVRFEAKLDQRFAEADAKLERRFAEADAKLERLFAERTVGIERRFAEHESRIIRWMITLWASQMIALFGILLAILRAP